MHLLTLFSQLSTHDEIFTSRASHNTINAKQKQKTRSQRCIAEFNFFEDNYTCVYKRIYRE